MIKTSGIILLALSTWLLWLMVSQFLLCARFQFNDPDSF
jgi:thiol:disulfide interchange protein